MTKGPLSDLRVLELVSIGPLPFAVMLLADLGADVVRVDRVVPAPAGVNLPPEGDVLGRGRRSVGIDLKDPRGVELVLRLVEEADVLVEGFRPGVAERLGLGPDACAERNPRLVYGRMTGWGQDGPLAPRSGHDINYAAIAGALHPVGAADRPPPPPLNLIADFGGGGLFLAMGVLAALHERERSGRGQVVDAAMVDGTAALTAMFHGMLAMNLWTSRREANILDGGAPFYRTYRCADGEFVAVGPLEPKFYAELLDRLDLEGSFWERGDPTRWPEQREALAEVFAARTRDEWAEVFDGSDACVTPVLSLEEAPHHPHMAARGVLTEHEGLQQPAPAPRFSRTPGALDRPPVLPGQHSDEVLSEAGVSATELDELRQTGVVG